MSGFVGIFNHQGQPIDGDLLQRMTNVLSIYAPDQQDIWQEGTVGLGHALLRTTWESENEHQPFTLDGEVWITGDIRLDRRDELISNLRSEGCHLKNNEADVDLVLHAYLAWGEACLDHFTGDFAFAIWNSRQQKLFCARDQFGVVPFYYADLGNSLVVSNNINCLRLHPQVSDTLNDHAIGDFLLFSMNMDFTTTTFADIQKLPPAHTLTQTRAGIKIRRYWQLPEQINYLHYHNPQDYIDQFRELFDQSVADRLRTNRAGTHLSGGLDSTSIAVTAYPMMQTMDDSADFRAYSIVYKYLIEEEEGKYAAQVAEMAGFPIEYLVAEDFIEQMPLEHPAYVHPEPLIIPDQMAEVEISQRIASFSRVLFAGFGGDPLLYPTSDYESKLRQQGQIQHALTDLITYIRARHRLPRFGVRGRVRQWLNKGQSKQPEINLPNWIAPDFDKRIGLKDRLQEQLTASREQARYGMTTEPLWSNIFAWSDPGFSGSPVKVRFPFFDVRLVSYMLSVPSAPWMESKFLLRQAMQGRLPESVRQRPKMPLGESPHYKLMKKHGYPSWARTMGTVPSLSPYIKNDVFMKLLESGDNCSLSVHTQSQSVLTLAYWLKAQQKVQHKTMLTKT